MYLGTNGHTVSRIGEEPLSFSDSLRITVVRGSRAARYRERKGADHIYRLS